MSNAQRYGGAEHEMKRLVKELTDGYGSGIDSPSLSIKYYLEHIGDLTHRLGEFMKYFKDDLTDEAKVELVFSGISFSSSKIEHAVRSTFFRDWPRQEKKLFEEIPHAYSLFLPYMKAHRKVPVFNKVQFHAREAAVALGKVDLGECHHHINTLNTMIKNGTAYIEACLYEKRKYR